MTLHLGGGTRQLPPAWDTRSESKLPWSESKGAEPSRKHLAPKCPGFRKHPMVGLVLLLAVEEFQFPAPTSHLPLGQGLRQASQETRCTSGLGLRVLTSAP